MNITESLVIKEYDNDNYPGKPFVLYIANNGRVGDKFNMDVGITGVSFPSEATDHFSTFEEAINAYHRFLKYVKDKINQAEKGKKKKGNDENGQSTKIKRNPSYYNWS